MHMLAQRFVVLIFAFVATMSRAPIGDLVFSRQQTVLMTATCRSFVGICRRFSIFRSVRLSTASEYGNRELLETSSCQNRGLTRCDITAFDSMLSHKRPATQIVVSVLPVPNLHELETSTGDTTAGASVNNEQAQQIHMLLRCSYGCSLKASVRHVLFTVSSNVFSILIG